MYPLVHERAPNDLIAIQLWLNLPKKSKMVSPSINLIWSENIPTDTSDQRDPAVRQIESTCAEMGKVAITR